MSIFHTTFVAKSYDTVDAIEMLKQYQVTYSQLAEVSQEELTVPKEQPKEQPEEQPIQAPVPNKHNAFFPDKKDTLFWSIYIGRNGITEYENIHRGYGNVEIAEKHKIMTFIKERPNRLKTTNIKLTNVGIQEIMSDIVTNATISVSNLPALAVFYNTRILLTKENAFYIDICPEEPETTLVLIKGRKGYGIHLEPDVAAIETTQFLLHRYDKPLQAISNYTTDELKEVAKRLGVDTMKKQKKAELYQDCVLKAVWSREAGNLRFPAPLPSSKT